MFYKNDKRTRNFCGVFYFCFNLDLYILVAFLTVKYYSIRDCWIWAEMVIAN